MRETPRATVAVFFVVVGAAAAAGAAPTVPKVTGAQMGKAVHRIVSAGYYADTSPVTNRSPRGTVIRQDPPAGAERLHGKPIRLAVSIGRASLSNRLPSVRIPNLIGKTARDARAKLVAAKLTMATKFRKLGASKVGKVIAQNPLGGVFRQYVTVTILVGK